MNACRRCLRRPRPVAWSSSPSCGNEAVAVPPAWSGMRLLVRLSSSSGSPIHHEVLETGAGTMSPDVAGPSQDEWSPYTSGSVDHLEGEEEAEAGYGGKSGTTKKRNWASLRGSERVATLSYFTGELHRACNESDLEEAFVILDKMSTLTLHPSKHQIRFVMGLCIRAARWDMALDLLGRYGNDAECGAVLHSMAIHACKRAGRWEEALNVLSAMKKGGGGDGVCHRPDKLAYMGAISACGAARQWRKALDLLAEASRELPELDTTLYNACISVCAKGEAWSAQRRVIREMWEQKVPWDRFTYNIMMDSWAKRDNAERALGLLWRMERKGIQPDAVSYNTVMAACVRRGWHGDALELFQRMPEKGLVRDSFSYAAAISACGASDKTMVAVMDLLDSIKVSGKTPCRLVYSAAVNACARVDEWQAALTLLEEMIDAKQLPEFWGYVAATEACGSRGSWRQTLALLQSVLSKGIRPGNVDYNRILLSACAKADQCDTTQEQVESIVSTKGLVASERELWAAVVSCRDKHQWKSLLSLVEKARVGDEKALKGGGHGRVGKKRSSSAPQCISVHLRCVMVLAGLRMGFIEDAINLFMDLEEEEGRAGKGRGGKKKGKKGDEGWVATADDMRAGEGANRTRGRKKRQPAGSAAVEREMVYLALVRALVRRENGWRAVVDALKAKKEDAAKQKARSSGGQSLLQAHRLALEVCCRAQQWRELMPILESYTEGGGGGEGQQQQQRDVRQQEALYDRVFSVMEEMRVLIPVSPNVAEAVWARERAQKAGDGDKVEEAARPRAAVMARRAEEEEEDDDDEEEEGKQAGKAAMV